MINNKFFTKTKQFPSPKRVGKLREVVDSTKTPLSPYMYKDDRDDLIRQNKDASRAEIADILENPENKINKTEGKKLAIFLKNYLSSLTILEYNQLHRTISSILDYNTSRYPMMEEYFNYHKSYDVPLFDSLFKIISEKVLFPKTENQEEFNSEFKSILYRYFNKTQKEAKKEAFSINTINTDLILTYMSEVGLYRFNDSIEIDGGINSFTYNINIKNPQSEQPIDNYNDFSYKISLGKIGGNGISRAEFYKYVKNREFKEINQNIFYLGGDRDFNVHMEIKERFVNNGFQSNGDDSKEVFDVEFFVFQKTELNTFEYFSNASLILNKEVSEFMSNLYKNFPIFPDSKNFINIDHNDIYDMIYNEETGNRDNSNKETVSFRGITNTTKNKTTNSNNIVELKYNYTIDDIILEDEEKEELKILLEMFKNPEHFEKFGIGLPKGTILYGPPGNGKTLTAKIVASAANAKFMYIKDTDVHTSYVGESARNLQNKIDEAKVEAAKGNKVVMFIDEADVMFEKRGAQKNYNEGMISVLLQAMDGFDENATKNIFIILGTNVFENLDPAVKSRFEKKIKYNNPSETNRIKHLELQIDKILKLSTEKLFDENVNLLKISKALDLKSGRFIEKLIKNTVSAFAYKRLSASGLITTQDIIDAIKYTKEDEDDEKEKELGFLRKNR
ncbi:MAG: ATP-binding protein [Candidatus Gracilibacteria bacterium]|nr:ATP-binding protein [Candidatus Gracilibacteria bacterium]